ncbi:hypothetical protein H4R18_003879 [Coemansia javaensis]|uniref:Uncharacterized protein n=1 Tax=Coemansia javaensis TaxID=2761396 RepID=A0A9W8LHW9_9FUNG|nr:hypothetical protein H4R18_003879 [Coemansia javaensis]
MAHYVVTLFGTGAFDGAPASVYVLGAPPEASAMRLMAQQQRGDGCAAHLFVAPAAAATYGMRCFGRGGELDVPALSAFAAARVLLDAGAAAAADKDDDKDDTGSIAVFEGARRTAFPAAQSGLVRGRVELGPVRRLAMASMERLVVADLFGIVRRGLELDHVEAHRTLVVYDRQSSVAQLRALTPRAAAHTPNTVAQLDVATVVVCVADRSTGGLYARAFSPVHDYAEVPMPVPATTHLRNDWAPDAAAGGDALFEIAWSLDGRPCRLIKRQDGPAAATLFVQATTQKQK